MKKTLILFTCILALTAMASCASIPTGTTADNDTASPTNSFDPDTAYAAILTESFELLSASSDSAEYTDEMFGIFEAAMTFGADAANTVGYVFRDVNADTIPELLIGVFDKHSDAHTKNEIYAAYTHDGNNPVLLFSGWARNSYALTDENTFYYYGSGGAANSIFGEYALSETGQFVCKNVYFTNPKEPEMTEIGYYHSAAGTTDPMQAEEWTASADEFWAVETALAAKTTALTATPFSAYTAANPT